MSFYHKLFLKVKSFKDIIFFRNLPKKNSVVFSVNQLFDIFRTSVGFVLNVNERSYLTRINIVLSFVVFSGKVLGFCSMIFDFILNSVEKIN